MDPNTDQRSLAERLADMPLNERTALLNKMSATSLAALQTEWSFIARPKQLPPPGDWRIWLIMAGRGFGKTRTGAEYVRALVESGRASRVALVGRSAADVRDVMVEGPSGLIAIAPKDTRPTYEPSKRRVVWPNGAVAHMFSADEPSVLRGPQFDAAWADELAAWRYDEAFDQLMFGLRLGSDPRCIVTTTPRPVKIIRDLMSASNVAVTTGSTYENRSNLAPQFFEEIIKRYEGTALGAQEIHAAVIDQASGALWTRELLDQCKVSNKPRDYVRTIVAIDPAMGGTKNETGIIVCALDTFGHAYVLEDYSLKATPDQWAKKAIFAYHKHRADRIVAEVNQGGDLVEKVLRTIDTDVSYKKVRASKGKLARAEPVAALYEQGKVYHVRHFMKLEDQLCTYIPGESNSPDRMDALVWGLTDLMLSKKRATGIAFGDFGLRAAPWSM